MELYFLTILSIVLMNVLVISSWPIEPTTGQDPLAKISNSEDELAEDGAFYNPNKVGGPAAAELYEIYPNLAYLGQFNQKFWYIDRTAVNYDNARANCSSMGMSIARIDHQTELNFLFGVTLSTDLPWVGATFPTQLSSFIWDGTVDEHPTSIFFTTLTPTALRFVRAANLLSSLTPATVSGTRFALCTTP